MMMKSGYSACLLGTMLAQMMPKRWSGATRDPELHTRNSAAVLSEMECGESCVCTEGVVVTTTLRRGASCEQPLGLHIDSWTGELVVTEVYDGELAAHHGTLRSGDVILCVNGRSCENISDMKEAIEGRRDVEIELRRPAEPAILLDLIRRSRTIGR